MMLSALLVVMASGPFELDPVTDGALLVSTTSFLFFSQMVVSEGGLHTDARKVGASPRGIDKPFADAGGAHRETYMNLSNYLMLPLTGGLVAADLVARQHQLGAWEETLTDLTLYSEALLINAALNNLVKIGVRRPRPYTYVDGYESEGTDDALSFYSGHTSSVATLSATATYLAFKRHSKTRGYITMATGLALTTAMASFRVGARKHFPTDVIAGALIGGSIGLLVPHKHVRPKATVSGAGQTRVMMLGLGGAF